MSTSSERSPPNQPPSSLEPQDIIPLLELMAELASLRNEPRTWRLELLAALMRILPATAAAAFIVKTQPQKPPLVVSIFDAGFKIAATRQAFLHEFNTAPFQDPLSKLAFQNAVMTPSRTYTVARSDLVDDAAWYASPVVDQFRRAAQIDDCLLSICRTDQQDPNERTLMVLCAFRRTGEPVRFSTRERAILDVLHAGLGWMYRAEEATHRLTRASALSPRLRQTLDFLLAGDTERQVALKMAISAHTVHDYVKALYVHFGVSSRGELLARWIQSGGEPPASAKKR